MVKHKIMEQTTTLFHVITHEIDIFNLAIWCKDLKWK